MRPEAPMFSPTIANSHVNLAVIRHEGSNGYGYSDHDATPRDLIVHETMKQLVEDLHDLRARCSTLETANAELHANMSALEASHASNTPGFPVVNGNGHRDLTGYASSETSSVGHPGSVQRPSQAESEARAALEKELERTRYNITGVKGRTGSLESKMKSLQAELEGFEIDNGQRRGRELTRSQSALIDNIEKKVESLQYGLGGALADIKVVQDGVQAQSMIMNGLDLGETGDNSGANADLSMRLAFLQAKLDDLKSELDATKQDVALKAKQRQTIDNCPTRDTLHQMYHQLTRLIDVSPKDRAGPFVGDEDELWALRDRVVCRLALFELYGRAVQEAMKAHVDL
ncbi:hypothetical protein LTR37_000563 [Vermiconidia calcicola]|uniref:Uncharacterized protein n=1 Tax=Vermiconidia calcicola TaxID=1690605 RepID=A0ACC3NY19_9PEZI|nr:hypothetical protein LTR37_000563 [Vermiconidia calcicola]